MSSSNEIQKVLKNLNLDDKAMSKVTEILGSNQFLTKGGEENVIKLLKEKVNIDEKTSKKIISEVKKVAEKELKGKIKLPF